MSTLTLATLNARYAHASLGLRSLMANLGEALFAQARLCEFTIKQTPEDICRELLEAQPAPRIIGFGVYIWNVTQTTEVVRLLKSKRPETLIVLGGPEVSHETAQQEIVALADHVITGEGEVSFPALCEALLAGERPSRKIIPGVLPDMETLRLPYALYDETDVRHRVVYVEASRGCPFRCEFCLSSLDKAVRAVPLPRFLAELESLLARGVLQFKFIDRTFNLKAETGAAILQFFLERYRQGMFLHFEMIPDRLPEALRTLIARFPPGALQFEIGVQTLDDAVSRRISRRQDVKRLEDNFRFLRAQTGVHLHADLIVGLPGETLETFGKGFDRLLALGPQEIQVGILKRLRGTPIIRHDAEWGMVYRKEPPYDVLETQALSSGDVERMRRFAKFWDLVHNSGNFRDACARILRFDASPFESFLRFSDWLFARTGRTHALALEVLAEHVLGFLVANGVESQEAGALVLGDYLRPGGRRIPLALQPFAAQRRGAREGPRTQPLAPQRQSRHLA